MSIEVKIPAVGESITSGVLSAWHKQNGDMVNDGEALFTLETDKISTEVPAVGSGKLRIQVDAGQEVKIGQLVALLEDNIKAPGGVVSLPRPPRLLTSQALPRTRQRPVRRRRLRCPSMKLSRQPAVLALSRKGMRPCRPPREGSPRKKRSSCRK